MNEDIARWIDRAKQGDRGAFNELYRRYYPNVVRRLSHLLGPQGNVSDVTQEAFCMAYRKMSQYRGESPFHHWLLRIATRLAFEEYRRQRTTRWRLWHTVEEEKQHDLCHAPSAEERYPNLQAVHRALDRLSGRLREAVILFELEGLTLEEMSGDLGIPLHTAASRVRRGREQLRRELYKMGFFSELCPAQGLYKEA